MIKFYIKNTHGKFFFDECTKEEKDSLKKLLIEKFTVKDSSLERDYRVIRGQMSPYKCFYNEEYDIIQSGLWPYISAYAKKENIQLEIHDLRKFQKPNLKRFEQIKKNGIGDYKTLRDFQPEAIEACLKYQKGIVCLPPASGKTLISGILTQVYDKSRFLFLFDRVDLLDQTYREFTERLKIPKEEIDIVGAGESDSTGARIILLSLMSYKNVFPEFPYIDILIADECLPGDTLIYTESGRQKTIASLVNSKSTEKVLSYNEKTNTYEYKKIYNWYDNGEKNLYKINFYGKSNFKITQNHKVYLIENDKLIKKRVDELKKGDQLVLIDKTKANSQYFKSPRGRIGAFKLNKIQQQVLIGTVLGDSHISLNASAKVAARLRMNHCEKQKDYLNFKKELLSNLNFSDLRSDPSSYTPNKIIYSTTSKSSNELKNYHNLFYLNKKKIIKKELLNLIDDISLAFWIMDDGSRSQKNDYTLSTHSFSKKENLLLVDFFKKRFNLDCKISLDGRSKKYYIRFSRKEGLKISSIISPYVPNCMNYKLDPKHRNNFKNLEVGKKLEYTTNEIESIEKNIYKERVYNISVEDNHNYVIQSDILVGNCHSTGRTETSEKIIFSCQNAPHTFGFSATPDVIGEDNPYEQMRLYANIGPIIYKKTFEQQMDSGVLADTTVYIHKINSKEKLPIVGSWNDIYSRRKIKSDKDKEALIKEGYEIIKEGSEEIARKFIDYGDESRLYTYNENRNLKIKEIAESSERCLILFSKIKHGELLKSLIPNSILVHGKDDRESRNKAKDELAKNKNTIIIASSIFDVGVDLPSIRNLIIASSHINTSRIIQKAGRATRKNESIGKLVAAIHDFDTNDNQIAIKQTKRKIQVYKDIMKLKMEFV